MTPALTAKSDPAAISGLQKQFLKCLLTKQNALYALLANEAKKQSEQQEQSQLWIPFFINKAYADLMACLNKFLPYAYRSGELAALKQLDREKPDFTYITDEQKKALSMSGSLIKVALASLIARFYADHLLGQFDKQKAKKSINESLKRIAATESLRQKVNGAVDTFKLAGLKKAAIKAEFRTAGDGLVCPRCAQYDHKVLPLDEIKALIPLHPNCRCWFFVIKGSDDNAQD